MGSEMCIRDRGSAEHYWLRPLFCPRVELIDTENWSSMQADTKGDIYEGLLEKSAKESPKGAGQYFTPRQLIQAIVDCVEPTPDDTVCDPVLLV